MENSEKELPAKANKTDNEGGQKETRPALQENPAGEFVEYLLEIGVRI